jgi:hypothetical protein
MNDLLPESPPSPPLAATPACLPADFACPPAAYRGKPFWSWNGKLERAELLRQLEVARAMGMGGVFMHSRTGLETPYLGSEWFDLTRACADSAAAQGLEAWIYDEDRWPSGSAGGLVTRDETFRMRSMSLRIVPEGAPIDWPAESDLLGAFLADLSGLDLRHYAPVAHGSLRRCPDGATLLLVVHEIHAPHSFYNGGTYLDTLSTDATARFLAVTHEAYARECGEHLGRSIKGVFTDEPHRGFIFCDAVAQPGASDPGLSAPYTEKLFAEFHRRFGYRLEPRLPELFFRHGGERLSPLKWHYVELLQQLFIENWARPCLDWCHDHDLLLTGHVLHEDTLAGQAVPCGSLARYYEQMDYPGIDVLGLGNRAFWVAKQVVSVARQLGKPFVLSELYGCTGWQLDFDGHKEIGDWQAVLGVNLRCHHLSWFTMAGEAKRDYPASIFHQSAWYREYHYVEDYYARLHLALAQGEPDCDVLVLHPVESLWSQIHIHWATWLQSASAPVLEVEKTFEQLFRWLTGAQLDFDYGDEEQLARLGVIETTDAVLPGPVLRLGRMRYRAVVVGGLETIRASTLRVLRDFAAAGGSVIFAGDAPSHVDAVASDTARVFAQSVTRTPWSRAALLAALRPCSAQSLRIEADAVGAAATRLLAQVRRLPGGEWFVAVVNTDRTPVGTTQLHLATTGRVEEWDCRTGETRPVASVDTGAGLAWTSDFGPLTERLFRITPDAPSDFATAPAPENLPPALIAELPGPFAYELSEPNVCVLDHARFRLGEDLSGDDEILRIDEAVRARLGWSQRSGEMVQPWCRTQTAATAEGPPLELRFSFEVAVPPPALDLLLEQPERWTLWLNDAPVAAAPLPDAFIDLCFKRVPLPVQALRPGVNELVLSTRLREDTQLEAIYLLGAFGVTLHGTTRILTPPPATLAVGDLTAQGLPFYGGVVTYLLPPPPAAVTLEIPSFAGACLKIRAHAADPGHVLGFSPHRAALPASPVGETPRLDVFLTRQNMFGPLHRLPMRQNSTGPASFRTTGPDWCYAPQLFPSGLLAAPRYLTRS